MNGQAPWFAGSSWTQTMSSTDGYAETAAAICSTGQRVELLDPDDRGVGDLAACRGP